MDYRTSPQTSDVYSEDMDSASARGNTLLSNNTPTPKPSTFKSSYAPVENVAKPVIRGRKTFAFWTLVCLLFMLAIGNLILTITILGVLKLGQGMESLELLPVEQAIKFFGMTDLDNIYKRDGLLEGYEAESVEIESEDGPIIINLTPKTGRATTKLKIDENEIVLRGFNSFQVINKENQELFNAIEPDFGYMKNANNLETKFLTTNRIKSPSDENLNIEGDSISLQGAEGTKIEAKEILWRVDQDIYLKSINGSIVLSGKEGAFIDVNKIPLATLNLKNYITAQFKICVCMPQGKLFRIPVANPNDRVYCHHINTAPELNPCM